MNATDIRNRSLLFVALYTGNAQVFKKLVKREANLTPKLKHNQTMLHVAAKLGYDEILR